MFGWNKKVSGRLSNLVELQAETISLSKLKEILYDTYESFYIWGKTEKEGKTLRRVQAYSIAGPGGKQWVEQDIGQTNMYPMDTSFFTM
jgi:hypothetical protein